MLVTPATAVNPSITLSVPMPPNTCTSMQVLAGPSLASPSSAPSHLLVGTTDSTSPQGSSLPHGHTDPPGDNPLEAIDLQALITSTDFDTLPPLHTIHAAVGNKLQMDVVKMPAAIMQMAFNSIYILLSMLTTAALDRTRSNDNLRYKKMPFGNGDGKQSLDDSFFPPEDTLNTATFLQAYQNWLSVVDKIANAALAKGWHCHHVRMLADTSFTAHLPASRILDRMLCMQFTDKPFLVDPNDPMYFAMFERAWNSISHQASSYLDSHSSRYTAAPDPAATSHSMRYSPYDKDHMWSGNSFREIRKPAHSTLSVPSSVSGVMIDSLTNLLLDSRGVFPRGMHHHQWIILLGAYTIINGLST
ncbi:hypothetical protein JB92DRAFT_3126980 [Gautieria morchelliformis]|nr:hypothetical protein JB92DRAFT_3126980 [Gautieria morchelliformis]